MRRHIHRVVPGMAVGMVGPHAGPPAGRAVEGRAGRGDRLAGFNAPALVRRCLPRCHHPPRSQGVPLLAGTRGARGMGHGGARGHLRCPGPPRVRLESRCRVARGGRGPGAVHARDGGMDAYHRAADWRTQPAQPRLGAPQHGWLRPVAA